MKTNLLLTPSSLAPPLQPITTQQNSCVESAFFRDIKPIFWTLRLMGLFPYNITPTGEMTFRILSAPTLYSLVVVATAMTFSVFVQAMEIEDLKTNSNFSNRFDNFITILVAMPIYIIPFTHWLELRKKVAFVNSWRSFEKLFQAVTQKELVFQLRSRTIRSLTLAVTISVCGLIVVLLTYFHDILLRIFPTFYTASLAVIMPCSWHIICLALKKSAINIAHEMKQQITFIRQGQRDLINDYRILWMKLYNLTQELGNSSGLTYGGQTLIYFSLQVLCAFQCLSNFGQDFPMVCYYAFLSLVIGSLIFGQCNCGQFVCDEVGVNFMKVVEKMEYTFTSHYQSKEVLGEIHNFLETIKNNEPKLSYCGFVTVNRTLITSFWATMATYMVVLIQVKANSLGNTPNNNTNPVN